ncbi:MAG: hypothetical protein P9L92_19900 [Candidatus Electryonea clarkiae]|nr:hypothetical protein [Candidatus Electryonea clarkiae]MDP8287648.1 hypothetical protein [Candidatus Electryonea clarkiae]
MSLLKKVLFYTIVLSAIAALFIGCAEDNNAISNDPGDGSIVTETGCYGCHIDAEKLEYLAVPVESGGSSGEG